MKAYGRVEVCYASLQDSSPTYSLFLLAVALFLVHLHRNLSVPLHMCTFSPKVLYGQQIFGRLLFERSQLWFNLFLLRDLLDRLN